VSKTEEIQLLTDMNSKYSHFSFEECVEIKRAIVSEHQDTHPSHRSMFDKSFQEFFKHA